ncbi:DUF2293 domain-containing protein [Georgenia yuyongxinii]
MAEQSLTDLHLDVYDTREGPWSPEHGEIEIPDDWAFLPSGDAFVTRTVKAAGPYWLAWRPRGRNRPHRRLAGVWAPAETIAQAQAAAAETAERRARQREQGARQRARSEDRYRAELAAAILAYLDFDAAHADLADQIANGAAGHAAIVGSGRVGRTRKLSLEDRAALAARAWIRHRFTDYEDRLNGLYGDDLLLDELDYRDIKHNAHSAVDAFLTEHRPRG